MKSCCDGGVVRGRFSRQPSLLVTQLATIYLVHLISEDLNPWSLRGLCVKYMSSMWLPVNMTSCISVEISKEYTMLAGQEIIIMTKKIILPYTA